MAQQINLHTPILLQPRKQFSAGAMARALLAMAVALGALGSWMSVQHRALQREGDQTEARQKAEQQQLANSLASLKQGQDRSTLEQQLRGLQQDNANQRQTLAELERGRAQPGLAHSDLLALVARTVPPPAWVTELKFSPERIEISGMTLEPAALQAWITQLSQSPALRGRPLAEVRVEEAGRAGSGLRGTAQADLLRPAALPSGQGWAFRIAADRIDAPAARAALEVKP
jgi:Tfp pilus assembly protein PilN